MRANPMKTVRVVLSVAIMDSDDLTEDQFREFVTDGSRVKFLLMDALGEFRSRRGADVPYGHAAYVTERYPALDENSDSFEKKALEVSTRCDVAKLLARADIFCPEDEPLTVEQQDAEITYFMDAVKEWSLWAASLGGNDQRAQLTSKVVERILSNPFAVREFLLLEASRGGRTRSWEIDADWSKLIDAVGLGSVSAHDIHDCGSVLCSLHLALDRLANVPRKYQRRYAS